VLENGVHVGHNEMEILGSEEKGERRCISLVEGGSKEKKG
jgi:hypothetical protein